MKKKVLVVDDEEVIRKFLKIYLGKWGYEVEEASDGEEAVGRLKRENLDLLISDVLMPRKDGWELLKEVRSSERTRELPVILLTAKNEDTDMFKGYGLGANYYLTKPFTKAQLFYGIQLMFGGNAGQESKRVYPGSSDAYAPNNCQKKLLDPLDGRSCIPLIQTDLLRLSGSDGGGVSEDQ